MTLREFAQGDLTTVIELWEKCGLVRPWNDPEQDILRAIACPSSTILTGWEDADLVCSCMVGHDGHRGWLYYVSVSPDHRSRGFGKQITSAAEEWLKGQGAIKVMLMVRNTNQPVIDFYKSAGYDESGSVPLEKWLTPDGRRPG